MYPYQSHALSHSKDGTDEASSNLPDFSWLDALLPLPLPSIDISSDQHPMVSSGQTLPQSHPLSLTSSTIHTSFSANPSATVHPSHATHSSLGPQPSAQGSTQSVSLPLDGQMLVMLRLRENEPVDRSGGIKAKQHWTSQDTTGCCRKLTVGEVEYLGLVPVEDDAGRRMGTDYYTRFPNHILKGRTGISKGPLIYCQKNGLVYVKQKCSIHQKHHNCEPYHSGIKVIPIPVDIHHAGRSNDNQFSLPLSHDSYEYSDPQVSKMDDSFLTQDTNLDHPVETQSLLAMAVTPSTSDSGLFEVSPSTPTESDALRQELQEAYSTIERMAVALWLLGMPPEDIMQL